MKFKRGLETAIGYKHYNKLKKRVGLALIILITALVLFTGYFLIFYARPCTDTSCFASAIETCRRVSWIREDAQASWLYVIKGNAEVDACKVQVKLLKMKQGTIDSEKLQGKQMTCILQKGETRFPEKDISRCSGVLKEELQDLIIQRMHNYLLENVGEIQEEFEGF